MKTAKKPIAPIKQTRAQAERHIANIVLALGGVEPVGTAKDLLEGHLKHVNYHVKRKAWRALGMKVPSDYNERNALAASLKLDPQVLINKMQYTFSTPITEPEEMMPMDAETAADIDQSMRSSMMGDESDESEVHTAVTSVPNLHIIPDLEPLGVVEDVKPGQAWQSTDKRRACPKLLVVNVEDGVAMCTTTDGPARQINIKVERLMSRAYKLVS